MDLESLKTSVYELELYVVSPANLLTATTYRIKQELLYCFLVCEELPT